MSTSLSFEGFNAKYLTFRKAGAAVLEKGNFVSMDNNFTVKEFKAGTDIIGKCVDVRDNLVTVQVSGYMTAPIASGQKITYGYNKISLDEDGKAKPSTEVNRSVFVVNLEGTKTVGFIL